MATPFPDVKIYIKDPDPEKILHWPGDVFDANAGGESTVSWKT